MDRNMAAHEVAPGQNGDKRKVHKEKENLQSILVIKISR